ncbi:hypothetical protein FDUTEX481_05095 [Tolypothrix sp. PCC 7601]|nr:hypothetical protein FDUTEX481_05095 [Tolypothrix sp. PCC 7601]
MREMRERNSNYELRITNYELRITNYELRITNFPCPMPHAHCIKNFPEIFAA